MLLKKNLSISKTLNIQPDERLAGNNFNSSFARPIKTVMTCWTCCFSHQSSNHCLHAASPIHKTTISSSTIMLTLFEKRPHSYVKHVGKHCLVIVIICSCWRINTFSHIIVLGMLLRLARFGGFTTLRNTLSREAN